MLAAFINWRPAHLCIMSTKTRQSIYGSPIRASAQKAKHAPPRGRSDLLQRAHARVQAPAQPSPTLGYALNALFFCVEVRCLGCDTYQIMALNIVRSPR
jgi:hypothetical protein